MFFYVQVFICCAFISSVASHEWSPDIKQYRSDYTYSLELNGWVKFHLTPATWPRAKLICHLEGEAILASPVISELHTVMAEQILNKSTPNAIYTGISDRFTKGYYFSVEGVPLSKIPLGWAPGEPNNLNNSESCLVMVSHNTLADVNCDTPFPYMCYKQDSTKIPQMNRCGSNDDGPPELSYRNFVYKDKTRKCYKFHHLGQNWTMASLICAAEGGHLAIINSYEEAEILGTIFSAIKADDIKADRKEIAFVGFAIQHEIGKWMTIHGETLKNAGYDRWAPGEPNNMIKNDVEQHCGAMIQNTLLDDMWCNLHTVPFICEKEHNYSRNLPATLSYICTCNNRKEPLYGQDFYLGDKCGRTLEYLYNKIDGLFYFNNPRIDEYLLFQFENPYTVGRYEFKSGSTDYPMPARDIDVEVLRWNENEFRKQDSFIDGSASGNMSEHGPLAAVRLKFMSNYDAKLELTRIWLNTHEE